MGPRRAPAKWEFVLGNWIKSELGVGVFHDSYLRYWKYSVELIMRVFSRIYVPSSVGFEAMLEEYTEREILSFSRSCVRLRNRLSLYKVYFKETCEI